MRTGVPWVALLGVLGLALPAGGQGRDGAPLDRSGEGQSLARASTSGSAASASLVDAIPRGPSVEERLAEIRRRIQRAVEYPPRARKRGLEGVATVGFEIDRADGRAREIQLVDSSGHPSLDRAAEQSVVRAGALPWVYGRLQVPVRFDLDEDR